MKNVRVFSVNPSDRDGFDIYLEFSGRREYLMSCRHNGLVYDLLCDGIDIDKLRRYEPKIPKTNSLHYRKNNKEANRRLRHTIEHILSVADAYISEREVA